jgi:signal transduction histidine kinase
LTPTRVATRLNEVVRDYLQAAAIHIDGIELELRLADDLPPIEADPNHLQQILGNLVRNAVQAMPSGGRLTIETARQEDGSVTRLARRGRSDAS